MATPRIRTRGWRSGRLWKRRSAASRARIAPPHRTASPSTSAPLANGASIPIRAA